MIEQRLEIVIITYNRASFLQRTLEQLSASPFVDCRITVLDNYSTDDTRQVAQRVAPLFPDFKIVTHPKNIGGNPNYLRAVEISTLPYTWILCDDDNFNFYEITDLLAALASDKYDILVVGSTTHQPWEAGLSLSARQAVQRGASYYFGLSFIPSIIFRTAFFDNACLLEAYNLVRSWYPQLAVLNKALSVDALIYYSRSRLVMRNEVNESTFSPLSWYANWVDSCSYIKDPAIRCEAIDRATSLRGYLMSLAFWIAIEKHHHSKVFWKTIATIFVGSSAIQRFKLMIFIPLMVVKFPLFFLIKTRQMVYRLLGVPPSEVPSLVVNDRD